MSWLTALARPNILRLEAYRSARSLATEAHVYLDANEAPGPVAGDLNRYPVPQPPELVARFAALYGVVPENVLVGRGSDEAIDLLTRAFCEPGRDEILITPPTYGMYRVSADIQNAAVVESPLTFDGSDWRLNVTDLSAKISSRNVKIVYICSPNNPTGTVFPEADLRALAATDALLVIDEAYIEFTPENSSVGLLSEFPNVVILRTLSKAWARAGLRCGVALGHPELIRLLQKVRAPYPLPRPVVDMALEALRTPEVMQERVRELVEERERLCAGLRELPHVERIYPSRANFVLARFRDESKVMQATAQHGVLVRSRRSELAGCVRLTVGSRAENDLLLKALREVRT